MKPSYNLKELKKFIFSPSNSYFSGNTKYEKKPERKGFYEIVAKEGDWEYRDSYSGHSRSRGTEVIRFKGVPVWTSQYGGGMVKGQEKIANETFGFLKKAFQSKKPDSTSFRGPQLFKDGKWTYKYRQEGELEEFNGYEEILFNGKVVFYHRIIGGTIKHE